MTTRQDIVDAINAADLGVTASTTPPRIPGRGQAWPEWAQSTPATAYGWETTWRVHVTLPNGTTEDAVLAGDGLATQIGDVLEQLAAIQTLEPTTLQPLEPKGAQGIPCLTYTITTV